MDLTKVRAIKKEMEELLVDFSKKHNVSITFGNGRYDDRGCRFKMAILDIGGEEALTDMNAAIFKAHAPSFGLKADDFHRTFRSYRGEKVKIVGIKPRSFKYPIICEKLNNGKRYKFSPNEVQNGLDNADA